MIPIEKEFERQKFTVMEETFDALAHVAGHSPVGTYDGKSTIKAFKTFRTMKHSYAQIKSFAEHLYNISRYFNVRENSELIRKTSRNLSHFADAYEMFL